MGPDPNKLEVFEIAFNLQGNMKSFTGLHFFSCPCTQDGGLPSSVTLTGAAQVHVPDLLTGVLHKET